MDCPSPEQISRYFASELSELERARLHIHWAHCVSCREPHTQSYTLSIPVSAASAPTRDTPTLRAETQGPGAGPRLARTPAPRAQRSAASHEPRRGLHFAAALCALILGWLLPSPLQTSPSPRPLRRAVPSAPSSRPSVAESRLPELSELADPWGLGESLELQHAVEELEARGDELSLASLEAEWRALLERARGADFEPLCEQRLETLRSHRVLLARKDFFRFDERWRNEWSIDMRFREALDALADFRNRHGELLAAEVGAMETRLRSFESSYDDIAFERRLSVDQAQWSSSEGIAVIDSSSVEMRSDYAVLLRAGKSFLELKLQRDGIRDLRLRAVVVRARIGEMHRAWLNIDLEDQCVQHNVSLEHDIWHCREWDLSPYLPGSGEPGPPDRGGMRIRLSLAPRAMNQAWIRQIVVTGRRAAPTRVTPPRLPSRVKEG